MGYALMGQMDACFELKYGTLAGEMGILFLVIRRANIGNGREIMGAWI